MDEALKFIRRQQKKHKPFFATIWYGSPHRPFFATPEDKKSLMEIEEEAKRNQYGEIVGIDRSMGNLRRTLREMGIEKNTIIWFNSDNGGLRDFG